LNTLISASKVGSCQSGIAGLMDELTDEGSFG